MDDYYIIEWRYRNPDPMLFNYWRRHSTYSAGMLVEELSEEQVRQELPAILANDRVEFKIIKVSHSYVHHTRFINDDE